VDTGKLRILKNCEFWKTASSGAANSEKLRVMELRVLRNCEFWSCEF
ncbi:hypothetical protein Tco_0614237, partial [Tanacetum coccineum]